MARLAAAVTWTSAVFAQQDFFVPTYTIYEIRPLGGPHRGGTAITVYGEGAPGVSGVSPRWARHVGSTATAAVRVGR